MGWRHGRLLSGRRSRRPALTVFLPRSRWPYVISRFDEEPDAFLYSFAANYKATLYARLDLYSNTAWQNLDALRSTLAEGNPVAFGFPVYDSINRPINWQGEVPYPQPGDKQVGGHAVLAVGYDDKIKIAGSKLDDSKGAIIFQNSWGEEWGDDGFGYLPYDYFLEGLAMDLWTVTSARVDRHFQVRMNEHLIKFDNGIHVAVYRLQAMPAADPGIICELNIWRVQRCR